MNKLLIASAALAVTSLGGPALAADMPLKAPPPPVPVFTWTGCYVGLSGGESYGRSEINAVGGTRAIRQVGAAGTPTAITLPAGTSIVDPFDLSGFIGGAQGGCNYQFGGWVIGIEGDYNLTNKEGQRTEGPLAAAFGFNGGDVWVDSTKERRIATARLRLGYAVWDKWLWYVTGGGAWAKIDSSEFLLAATPGGFSQINRSFTQTDWRGGWTVGVGTEYSLGYGWSIKSEFLYVDLGTFDTFTSGVPTNAAGIPHFFSPQEVHLKDYIFRFGMNYRFGGWGIGKAPAVVARY